VSDWFPFVVIGITTGAVYALAAMGLVVTYTTSGVFNFAHGAIGMFATYLFYSMRETIGLPTALAVLLAVGVIAPLMGAVLDRVLLRRLYGAPPATYVVASLGLLVGLQGLAIKLYGGETRQVAPLFPTRTYRLADVNVGYDQTIVVLIAVAAAFGLVAFFRFTRLGLQTRAVVGDRDLTEMVGTNAGLVTTISWMLGSAFAALSGILFSPFVQLDSLLLTLLVVQAFGAAIVGKLRSIGRCNLGAYGIAIAAALFTKVASTMPGLAGVPTALPFVVLFIVLVFSPKGSFPEVAKVEINRAAGRIRRKSRFPVGTLVAFLAVAALVPGFVGPARLQTATTTLAFVLIFASLSLLVGLSRQVSLCHTVFVLFGATTLAHFGSAGVPYGIGLLLACLAMVPIGALLAFPALRLSGLFLALATFGFGVLAQNLLFGTGLVFGRDAVANVPRPSFLADDTRFYFFVLATVAIGVIAVEVTRITRLGRVLNALADSPTAFESLGLKPTVSRVMVFCLSAFLAAVGGCLLGTQVQLITPQGYGFFNSLVYLTVLVLAGAQTLSGSILAALLFATMPAIVTSAGFVDWQPVIFGFGAILLAQAPNGLAGLVRLPDFSGLAERNRGRIDRRRGLERLQPLPASAAAVGVSMGGH
jgi:branched-subunit amino acid ABC-type transport system permease component